MENTNAVKALRNRAGMTQREFAEYFGIPRRTLEDWERDIGHCSDYLLSLMEYKLVNEGIIREELT